jgi:hypothetical protein
MARLTPHLKMGACAVSFIGQKSYLNWDKFLKLISKNPILTPGLKIPLKKIKMMAVL